MTHHLYIIAHKEAGGKMVSPVKVGITSNLLSRKRMIQTGNPKAVDISFSFNLPNQEIARHMERAFHDLQGERRMSGEWFDISPREALALMCLYLSIAIQMNIGDDDEELVQQIKEASGLDEAHEILVAMNEDEGPIE